MCAPQKARERERKKKREAEGETDCWMSDGTARRRHGVCVPILLTLNALSCRVASPLSASRVRLIELRDLDKLFGLPPPRPLQLPLASQLPQLSTLKNFFTHPFVLLFAIISTLITSIDILSAERRTRLTDRR